MLKNDVIKLFNEYTNKYQLSNWKLEFINRKSYRAIGKCSVLSKTIKINSYFIQNSNYQEVKHVLLHEIAHALTPGQGHNKNWKNKCIELGILPCRCFEKEKILIYMMNKEVKTKIYLGKLCKEIIKINGNNKVITYEPI